MLLDPDVDDAALRQELLTAVPEHDLKVDQFTLANWTRGDPKARFEETAQRHGVLSRFAEPFLTRMNFLDDRHQRASPTLEALRVYREGRAARRRTLPADAPLDFAPKALEPLIRRNGQVDRRGWESALFLKVRDEIRAGNLAIEGAKNFGRFDAFFLPQAEWGQVREDFWERTGFAVDPGRAMGQLKDRLTQAFDGFLESVSGNRQVTFGEVDVAGGKGSFGTVLRHGAVFPWARGPKPWWDLADSPLLSGSGSWVGWLLGQTPGLEAVKGSSALEVDLEILEGTLGFDGLVYLESSSAWSDGELDYRIEVNGNTFKQVDGDEGIVTGVFLGNHHGGMGGVLKRKYLTAAFGGRR